MQRCSVPLTVGEMQITTTMRYHYTAIRKARIKIVTKSSLGKFKKIEIVSSIFSDYNAMRLDIN